MVDGWIANHCHYISFDQILKQTTMAASDADARILVSTHGTHIHLLSLPPSPSTDLRLVSSLKLDQQPSYSLPHPHIPNLVYVSAWIPDMIFLVELRGDELVKVGETKAGGGGPTYFVMTPDRKSLLVANVSTAFSFHTEDD